MPFNNLVVPLTLHSFDDDLCTLDTFQVSHSASILYKVVKDAAATSLQFMSRVYIKFCRGCKSCLVGCFSFWWSDHSKPLTYAIGLALNGTEYIHKYVGMEPSGRYFNELVLDYNSE